MLGHLHWQPHPVDVVDTICIFFSSLAKHRVPWQIDKPCPTKYAIFHWHLGRATLAVRIDFYRNYNDIIQLRCLWKTFCMLSPSTGLMKTWGVLKSHLNFSPQISWKCFWRTRWNIKFILSQGSFFFTYSWWPNAAELLAQPAPHTSSCEDCCHQQVTQHKRRDHSNDTLLLI